MAATCQILRQSARLLVRPSHRANTHKFACFCSATPPTDQPASPSSESSAPAPSRPPPPRARPGPPVMRGPDGQPLEVVRIEKAGDEAWAGVAAIDRGEAGTDTGRVGLLVAGDITVLLAFAVIGRINHGEIVDVETISTALPFMIGWFTSAALLGGFGKEATGSSATAAAATAAKCWALGTPLGLVLRGLQKGYIPPKPFIIVSLAATGVLLVGWRTALAAATPQKQPLTRAQELAARGNKQGNPFEFLELLFSLVKRW